MIRTVVVVYVVLTALCWQFELTNSRTSTLWKLDSGKITKGPASQENVKTGRNNGIENIPFTISSTAYPHDENFYIITTTLNNNGGTGWVRLSPEQTLGSLITLKTQNKYIKNDGIISQNKTASLAKNALDLESTLDCGKPVNFTYYDYLIGIRQRHNHPHSPEPEVAYLFLKSKDENSFKNFDVDALERRLKRAKREKPLSVQLYNQIGNYWRYIGDTRQAIECFRRALAISPTNSEVLLNLARVLYNLQYLDDAIHLTRRSLEMKPPGHSAWQQYFTLGEIFKAYGHFHESMLHLRHALVLYPHHEPIIKALHDVENSPNAPLHIYTILIIIALIFAVFTIIFSPAMFGEGCVSLISVFGGSEHEPKTHRHFNRAMAMRSLKGLSSSRHLRHRRT